MINGSAACSGYGGVASSSRTKVNRQADDAIGLWTSDFLSQDIMPADSHENTGSDARVTHAAGLLDALTAVREGPRCPYDAIVREQEIRDAILIEDATVGALYRPGNANPN